MLSLFNLTMAANNLINILNALLERIHARRLRHYNQPAPVIKKLCVKGIMEFNDIYRVYVCPHVFKKECPIFVSIRDPYGEWQFFCDDENCPENSKPHLVGAGHLTQADPTINELTCLKPGSSAQKIHANSNWEYGGLE